MFVCELMGLKQYMMDNMSIRMFSLLLIFVMVEVSQPNHVNTDDMWQALTVRYNNWFKLPRTTFEAEMEGYERLNDICRTNSNNGYHGFLFQKDRDTKAMPIYDLNGKIAGIQAMIPGNMKGFDSQNNSIDLPPLAVQPPILKGGIVDKVQMYTVTAYFKHPELVCNPVARLGVQLGKGLYIQTGANPVTDYLQIPLHVKDLDPTWTPGICIATMGKHYFYNISKHMQCEKIFPVFLMYDILGNLGAFGWTFQGKPMDITDSEIKWFKLQPNTYAFTFDPKELPSCMFNPDFRIFGIHIWLQDHTSPTMKTCKAPAEADNKDDYSMSVSKIHYEEKTSVQTITARPWNSQNIINSSCRHTINFFSWILCAVTIFISVNRFDR